MWAAGRVYLSELLKAHGDEKLSTATDKVSAILICQLLFSLQAEGSVCDTTRASSSLGSARDAADSRHH